MLLDEIANKIAAEIPTLVRGQNLFCELMPASTPTPPNSVAIYGYQGEDGVRVLCPPVAAEIPRFQVAVRNDTPALAWSIAYEIYGLLGTIVSESLSGTYYGFVQAVSPPFHLRLDENERSWIACNYRAQRKAVA